MPPDGHCLIETALGPIGLAWRRDVLVRLRLPQQDGTPPHLWPRNDMGPAAPSLVADFAARLRRYAAGEPVDFSGQPIDLGDIGAFEARVYEATRALRWGETATYGEIARRAGEPQAARAVGRAMARNKIPLVVPCHRVLASGHRPGGFSAPGGLDFKARLLAMEGVAIDHMPRLPGL